MCSDSDFLTDQHKHDPNYDKNVAVSKLAHYSPMKSEDDVMKNQLYCDKHLGIGV